MPLYQNYSTRDTKILCWKYDEYDVLDDSLIHPNDFGKVKDYHPKKLLEYKMVRQMLRIILPEHQILYKAIGQPFLKPQDQFLSISHSFPFAAIAISEKRIGIDMEKIQSKISKVKHKFLHPTEWLWTENEDEIELLTIIWAVKEALYKLHPCKYWSLKKFYEVSEFSITDVSKIHCRVFDENFEDRYIANVSKIENYYFALIEENHQINYQIPVIPSR